MSVSGTHAARAAVFALAASSAAAGCTCGAPASPACTPSAVKRPVDIVFVIDNSGSMGAEMEKVRANLNAFAGKIDGRALDYQVVLLTRRATKPDQKGTVICVPPPLGGPACADNPPKLRHIDQSIGSTDALTRLLSTYDHRDPKINWSRSLRFDAVKVFIAVTDDQSSMSAEEFDRGLLAKEPAGMFGTAAQRKYVFHSIVGWQDGTPLLSSQKCRGAENPGLRYQELSKLTGGYVESVCKTDYSGVLDRFATGIIDSVTCAR